MRLNFLSTLLYAVIGSLIAVGCAVIFGLLMFIFMDDLRFSGILSTAACVIGSLAGSYLRGKLHRRRGLVSGFFCGLAMYCLFSAASLITAGVLTGVKKLLLLTVTGCVGGVWGVNSKRPKNLM